MTAAARGVKARGILVGLKSRLAPSQLEEFLDEEGRGDLPVAGRQAVHEEFFLQGIEAIEVPLGAADLASEVCQFCFSRLRFFTARRACQVW